MASATLYPAVCGSPDGEPDRMGYAFIVTNDDIRFHETGILEECALDNYIGALYDAIIRGIEWTSSYFDSAKAGLGTVVSDADFGRQVSEGLADDEDHLVDRRARLKEVSSQLEGWSVLVAQHNYNTLKEAQMLAMPSPDRTSGAPSQWGDY